MARATKVRASGKRKGAGLNTLADLTNVGAATLGDFEVLGIKTVADLAKQEAFSLYDRLCTLTKARHDPCVIDVFMATIDEARGGPPTVWWKFTPERKRLVAARGLSPGLFGSDGVCGGK